MTAIRSSNNSNESGARRFGQILGVATLLISILSLAISGLAYNFAVNSFNIANNYPPYVDVRQPSPLRLTENCGLIWPPNLTAPTTKRCTLSGTFNVTIAIISPHNGIYEITDGPFSPYLPSTYWLQDLTFLGRNLTLVDYTITDNGYVIKAWNRTSSHFAYFAEIGNFELPKAYEFETPIAIAATERGNVPASSFEKTVTVQVRATITRPANYSSTVEERFGTFAVTLTYTDIQLERTVRTTFPIEVWIVRHA